MAVRESPSRTSKRRSMSEVEDLRLKLTAALEACRYQTERANTAEQQRDALRALVAEVRTCLVEG